MTFVVEVVEVVEVTRTIMLMNVKHRMESQAIVCYSPAVLKSYLINGKNKNCVHVFTSIGIFHSKYVILLFFKPLHEMKRTHLIHL